LGPLTFDTIQNKTPIQTLHVKFYQMTEQSIILESLSGAHTTQPWQSSIQVQSSLIHFKTKMTE